MDVGVTKPRMLMLSWQMRIINKKSQTTHKNNPNNITFTATVRYESQVYHLHYVPEDFLIKANKENNIFHGLGFKSFSTWHNIIRDLGVDLQKGININAMSQKIKKSKIMKIVKSKVQLESISITCTDPDGVVILLDNMTLSTNEHLAQFYQAADWFVAHQDVNGGWPIPVRRKFGSDFYPVLESGWYSAMGQGHALSLLARAYSVTTNNSHYGEACAKAVSTIFDKNGADNGGVRAMFMDKFVWYEEYPTSPSSFVLNGFMYALLGLYDVKSLNVLGAADKAESLYDLGLISLKTMLPLYDTGSGTFYDLRHYTVAGISPNLARLDYHVTHINQLLTFATFEKDPIFKTIAERWVGYTEGNRAPHN
jgi:heparosan-N-sulfate-glucuronate 5-epimerase